MKRLLLALAVTLAACNAGQPRTYRVAIDTAPLNVTDATCFKNGSVPSYPETTSNLFAEQQWVVWDGVLGDGTQVQYLDFGSQSYKLGNSPAVAFDELVRSFSQTNPGVFQGQRQVSKVTPNNGGTYVQTATGVITVNFSDLGTSPSGSIVVESRYQCTPVAPGVCPLELDVTDPKSCKIAIPFSARRIETSRIATYEEDAKN